MISFEDKLSGPTLLSYQEMWGNNGDIISRQYAGTAAMKVTICNLVHVYMYSRVSQQKPSYRCKLSFETPSLMWSSLYHVLEKRDVVRGGRDLSWRCYLRAPHLNLIL